MKTITTIFNTIQSKIIGIFILFLLLEIVILLTIVLSDQAAIGKVINVAGRQRMLSQKMTKEVLSIDRNSTEEKIKSLRQTTALFQRSLLALQKGDQQMGVKLITNEAISKQIAAINLLWTSFQKEIKSYIENGDSGIVDFIEQNNLQLLKESNKLVMIYEGVSKKQAKDLNVITISMVTLTVTLIIFVIIFFIKPVFNRIRATLNSMATKMLSVSDELVRSNGELTDRTSAQAASVEETAATLEEITATVKLSADNSQQASSNAQTTTELVQNGQILYEQVQSSMEGITESSNQIADIISLVQEIAFQTNILAINAAIEAAKAGDQGKGFAVVAIEIRNLAQRTEGATKDIKELISTSLERVESGQEMVNETGEKFTQINDAIKKVYKLVNSISVSSSEQRTAIEQINIAVTQIDSSTQQNSILVEELQNNSQIVANESSTMQAMILRLFGS